MSSQTADPGHGHSPAAWTAVATMLVAFVVGTVAFYFAIVPVVIGAAVLALLGLLAGYVMKKMGYGVNGPKFQSKEH